MSASKKGRGTKDEKPILSEIRDMVGNDYMAYWILWKFAPDLLAEEIKSFDDLKNYYKAITKAKIGEHDCEKWMYYDKVQNAVKWLLKKQKGARMIELYNIWFEMAKKDSNALKEFIKLQDIFFQNDEMSEVESILRGASFKEEEEDYDMEI